MPLPYNARLAALRNFPLSIFHSPHAVPLQRSIDAPAIPLRQLPHLLCKQHGERQEDHPRKTEQAIASIERQERQQRRQADLPPEQARLKGRAGEGRGGIGDGQAEGKAAGPAQQGDGRPRQQHRPGAENGQGIDHGDERAQKHGVRPPQRGE